ncbi:GNAT family N-acetyltransferase [Sphingomonas sp. GlSt437]|uniref:GNAT family N-acetyltransferase n=1 Tax=Sphingomonas sp. GlSt437 TaxID=3389970 RepID=UPI003A88F64D
MSLRDPIADTDELIVSSPRDPLAKPLLDALVVEYGTRYRDLAGRGDGAAFVEVYERYPPELFEAPRGGFLLLLRDGRPIAGGGFMPHADAGTAEFKRIWTADAYRRQGLARRVVLALEELAVDLGYTRVYLTTGFRQPEAEALYRRLDYTALFDPHEDLAARFTLPFEKTLIAAQSARHA